MFVGVLQCLNAPYVRCSKGHVPFLQLSVSNGLCNSCAAVQLRNLFLLNKRVAQMLLTPRWISRQKDVE